MWPVSSVLPARGTPPPPYSTQPPVNGNVSVPPSISVASMAGVVEVDLERQAGWPVEVTNAVQYLVQRDWGLAWKNCVRAYVHFEQVSGFPDDVAHFSTRSRPMEVGRWISYHCKLADWPIKSASDFGQQWWVWWTEIQPEARLLDERSRPLRTEGGVEWAALTEKSSTVAIANWDDAVADVAWTFDEISKAPGLQREWPSRGEPADSSNKKRKNISMSTAAAKKR
ncbi:hypothetical protein SCP_0403580 [Sparassis crispa]|uniref:Uncharacterized protein n=1 Tax=Sparassis crispa TaxID=139825 RepID=A0A401GII5_9APHY|nr:hypothetical protein SCP_0403580 [Sparassis crispa]GBE81982.1 hypothetical protein SCP_0403580 [Sparassis crispa]